MRTNNELTVTENRIGTGELMVIVYDANDKVFAELGEADISALYFTGIFREAFGSKAFKDHVKNYVRGN